MSGGRGRADDWGEEDDATEKRTSNRIRPQYPNAAVAAKEFPMRSFLKQLFGERSLSGGASRPEILSADQCQGRTLSTLRWLTPDRIHF